MSRLNRFMELPDEGRKDMTGLQVEVVAGAIQVGRHDRDESFAVLGPVGLAHLDARDLCHRIGFVGGFEMTAKQLTLPHGLVRELRIDTRTPQEEELFDLVPMGGVDTVQLDGQVIAHEIRGISGVRHDAPHLGRRKENDLGAFRLEKAVHGPGITEVQLVAIPNDEASEPLGREAPDNRRSHQPLVSGHEDPRVGSEYGAHRSTV